MTKILQETLNRLWNRTLCRTKETEQAVNDLLRIAGCLDRADFYGDFEYDVANLRVLDIVREAIKKIEELRLK